MQPSSGGFLLYTVFSTEAAAFVMPMLHEAETCSVRRERKINIVAY
jgi:hypothetical protein